MYLQSVHRSGSVEKAKESVHRKGGGSKRSKIFWRYFRERKKKEAVTKVKLGEGCTEWTGIGCRSELILVADRAWNSDRGGR